MSDKVIIKTKEEIEVMRKAGKILARIVIDLEKAVKPGVSTGQIDELAYQMCVDFNVKPAFKGYGGFPATVCTGLNDVVVHGIPGNDEVLQEGDILSIDMGVILDGFYSDHAVTVGVGEISKAAQKLIDGTRLSRDNGIKNAVEGKTLGDIGFAMEETANLFGFSVVKQMVGHGVGRHLHEAPEVPGYGEKGKGMKLKEGMTLAIEAIINQGDENIYTSKEDEWTTRTKDGKLSALFEHTVVVGKTQPIILTAL